MDALVNDKQTYAVLTRAPTPALQRKLNKNIFSLKLTDSNTEPDETTNNPTPDTTATIPYIKGTPETIAQVLQPYHIRVAHKPITTLRHVLTNVKDKDQPHDRQEWCIESNVLTVMLLILGELAET